MSGIARGVESTLDGDLVDQPQVDLQRALAEKGYL